MSLIFGRVVNRRADTVCSRAENDVDSISRQIRRGSRRWKQYNVSNAEQCDVFAMKITSTQFTENDAFYI